MVSNFSQLTLEQRFIQRKLLDLGVELKLAHGLGAIAGDHVKLACIYTGRPFMVDMDAAVLVTARLPNDKLALELKAQQREWLDRGIRSVTVIGDAQAPGAIVHAVYSGHRFGRLLDSDVDEDAVSFRREVTELSPEFPPSFA